jgi:hypothetical protein
MAITRREFIQGVGAAGLATAAGCAAARTQREPALPIPAKPSTWATRTRASTTPSSAWRTSRRAAGWRGCRASG